MTEKLDIASAARKLKSPNIKTRKRALQAIHDLAKQVKISK
ncbi:putative metal homeostasis protein [Leuconostoc gasicomitatum]|nr:putative metal homeostasis protein [Leuconostoc gasicomitatum]MBZ5944411.1 putative metal homeostasis protein [Leuconostoc gasicomitatum]MBZ5945248.1 putative metal homeostasis protein [Leuconostoc gasicomitatum]MBZ5946991.1 putative metal homeostasis protein [Leuconostoc gasicomitatum]MBZ5950379.1 putative metal homeostasis protein [Leuconostoc gasicomitatum]MBZ5950906.1 putative metal homeostasis protein [Leuconostoc gasicomitatum]